MTMDIEQDGLIHVETLLDRLMKVKDTFDIDCPHIRASFTERFAPGWDEESRHHVLRFYLTDDDGEEIATFGRLHYLEARPGDREDPEDVMVHLDDVTSEAGEFFDFLRGWWDDDPSTPVMLITRVIVDEDWRGMGLAKYMLLAAPVIMKRLFHLVATMPWRDENPEETERLRTVGFLRYGGPDGKIFWRVTGEEYGEELRKVDMILTDDGPYSQAPDAELTPNEPLRTRGLPEDD
jgi:GNAT superfamily N-acetyltransferase